MLHIKLQLATKIYGNLKFLIQGNAMLNFFLDDFQKKSQNVWLKCVRAPASPRTSQNRVKT